MKKTLLILSLFFMSIPVLAKEIDLTKETIYVRKGFSQEWLTVIPEGNKWTILKNTEKIPSIKLANPDLNIPGIPRRSFFSFDTKAPENFTFIIPFPLKKKIEFPAIYIKDIGLNWEIFINGKSIKREIHLDQDGAIKTDRSLRNQVHYINPNILKEGINIAGFRIIGDPTNPFTGFYRKPILIGNYHTLEKRKSEIITLILISIYLIIGIFHISLFITRTTEKYNLFYGIASIAYFLYIFLRSNTIFTIIPNSAIVNRLELIVLYTILPLLGSFLELIILKKISIVTKIYSGFCGLLILATIPFSDAFSMNLLRIWQLSSIILLYYGIVVIGIPFRNSIRAYYEQLVSKNVKYKKLRALYRSFISTVPGNLLVGIVVVIACVAFDIIDAAILAKGLSISQYGMFFLLTGIAFILSNRFLYIHTKVEKLNVDLEQKINDLNQANELIKFSEERYRLLVEGSEDIIFTLDETLAVRSVNKAIKKKFNIEPETLKMTNFLDFVKEGAEGQSVEYQYVLEKLDELKEKKRPIYFKTSLKRRGIREPVELQVKLEYLDIEGKNEILGKASNIVEDSLLKYFKTERSSYSIGNYLTTAEEISHRATRNLQNYMPIAEANMVRLALREILINAIEHGNLEITFDDKTEAQMNDTYFKLVSSKQIDDRLKERNVEVEYKISEKEAVYKITDEGNGFDHTAIMEKVNSANEELLEHGRGIVMAYNIFDKIQFNNKGNQVLLVKNIEPEK